MCDQKRERKTGDRPACNQACKGVGWDRCCPHILYHKSHCSFYCLCEDMIEHGTGQHVAKPVNEPAEIAAVLIPCITYLIVHFIISVLTPHTLYHISHCSFYHLCDDTAEITAVLIPCITYSFYRLCKDTSLTLHTSCHRTFSAWCFPYILYGLIIWWVHISLLFSNQLSKLLVWITRLGTWKGCTLSVVLFTAFLFFVLHKLCVLLTAKILAFYR